MSLIFLADSLNREQQKILPLGREKVTHEAQFSLETETRSSVIKKSFQIHLSVLSSTSANIHGETKPDSADRYPLCPVMIEFK